MGREIEVMPLEGFPEYTACIADSIKTIQEEWDTHCGNNIYVASDFLSLLEECGPIGYSYYYIIIKKNEQVKGLVYCQHKTINLANDFRVHAHSKRLMERIKVMFTKAIFKRIKHEMLICGNVVLTGEYAFRLDTDLKDQINALLPEVLAQVRSFVKTKKNKRIQSTLLKDFYLDGPLKKQEYSSSKSTGFKVQPDMILSLKPEWTCYDDYLAAVKSKYRVKFKKVKKKASALSFRTLDAAQARQYNANMYRMYKDTADRATFNMFLLNENYFGRLKEVLADEIVLTGIFLEDKMVAFFTYVKNGDLGDAHFLGYDVSLNMKYQIYFNILLCLIETAIDNGARYLNLSRTALEIKSSVGAEPYDMQIHLQYHTTWINKCLPFLMKRFVPANEWLQRSPFK